VRLDGNGGTLFGATVVGRILAIALFLLVVGAGWHMSGRSERNSVQRVNEMRETLEVVEPVDVGELKKVAKFDEGRFAKELADDVAAFGLEPVDVAAISAPQAHHMEVAEPVILRTNGEWSSPRVSVTATVEKVNYQQHGAIVSAPHRVVTLVNKTKGPIAYKLVVGAPGKEKCKVRGSRVHNAMALRPGETAEVVVCAGRGRVVIRKLQLLEINELGYHYISQLPPSAVGYDTVTAHAHRPRVRVTECTKTDPTKILRMLGTGSLQWVDVVDFYSRHNCHRMDVFDDYRHSAEARARMPAMPPGSEGA